MLLISIFFSDLLLILSFFATNVECNKHSRCSCITPYLISVCNNSLSKEITDNLLAHAPTNDHDVNCASLKWAQEALFVVCLDEGDRKPILPRTWPKSVDNERDLALRGKHISTGGGSRAHGLNRWYDATVQLIVGSSGTSGFCFEHSAVDGIVIINVAEHALRYERENREKALKCLTNQKLGVKALEWHIDNTAVELLEMQKITLDKLTQEFEIKPLVFKDFGKDFIKSRNFSPDGFVQLALQLAHFKLHGYLVSTHEAASLRRFRAGRYESIRSNTNEVLAWVKAMASDSSTETRLNLLKKAAEKQANLTAEVVSGMGIDTHLFALFVLARQSLENGEISQLPGIFADPMWNELMRFPLETSQVTISEDISDSYVCYGARDEYACSYNLQKDFILFVPTSYKSNPRTDLTAFRDSLLKALQEMKALLTD